jgi:hypothetical protein
MVGKSDEIVKVFLLVVSSRRQIFVFDSSTKLVPFNERASYLRPTTTVRQVVVSLENDYKHLNWMLSLSIGRGRGPANR